MEGEGEGGFARVFVEYVLGLGEVLLSNQERAFDQDGEGEEELEKRALAQ